MKKYLLPLILVMLIAISAYHVIDLTKPSIIGKAILGTRLIITTRVQSECNITFRPGWNLVSFPCITNEIANTEFFDNFTLDSVRTYAASDLSDPWKSYNPSLPSYVIHDMDMVSRSNGYWVYVVNESEFYKNNTLGKPTIYSLRPGWNLIGYPNITSTNVYNLLETIIPYFDYAYMYNATDADWKEWTWNSSLPSSQDLNMTTYYQGYWIYMITNATYVVG